MAWSEQYGSLIKSKTNINEFNTNLDFLNTKFIL